MKNKLSFRLLSRWVFAPLLVGSLVAWGVSPVYPRNNLAAKENHSTPKLGIGTASADAVSGVNSDMQEIKDRIKELEAKEQQSYLLVLEGQRKTMDWWFSFLAVLTAIMAIFGALIPFLMARKDKEIIEQDRKAIEQDKVQIRYLLDEVKGMKADAKDSVEEIHRHEAEAKAAKETVLAFQSGTTPVSDEKTREAVEKIEQDKTADPLLRLRAEAVSASKPESAEKAYRLWAALAELAGDDGNSELNAGYWAAMLSKNCKENEKPFWLELVKRHSAKSFHLNPQEYWAANNWGVALADEAHLLSKTDLDDSRALWNQAGEKYRQALAINPGLYEAAYNWGMALAAEARALTGIVPEVARGLWREAGEKYRQTLAIKPDEHEAARNWGTALIGEANLIAARDSDESQRLLEQAEQLMQGHAEAAPGVVAYNLACVYGVRADVQRCLQWLRVSQEHGELPDCEHLRTDKDLDSVRDAPEFIEWLKQVCP
ncbi:MAG: hypothetical protein WA056_12175 [Gallionella sp.]